MLFLRLCQQPAPLGYLRLAEGFHLHREERLDMLPCFRENPFDELCYLRINRRRRLDFILHNNLDIRTVQVYFAVPFTQLLPDLGLHVSPGNDLLVHLRF